MLYIEHLKRSYPRTYKVRHALQQYNSHVEWEGQDPSVITIHETTLNYGGPEEGGWWYQEGHPCLTHCIFSKKQAVKEYVIYADEYDVWDQPSLGISTTSSNYEVNFSNDYAKHYPEERPYYC